MSSWSAPARASPASRASASTPAPASIRWISACRRSEEHTSELQSHLNLVCRLLLEKKKNVTDHAFDRSETYLALPPDGSEDALSQLTTSRVRAPRLVALQLLWEVIPRLTLFELTYCHPEDRRAAVEVLDHAGVAVLCNRRPLFCGLPVYELAMQEKAKDNLLQLMRALVSHNYFFFFK